MCIRDRDKGIIYRPNNESLNCYVDSDFIGNWNINDARDDPSTAKSRTGYIITFGGCPVIWKSTMQSIITLSSTEAEYVAMSTAMREVLPMMQLLTEFKKFGIMQNFKDTKIHCTIFEDNSGAIEIATVPKMRPRTKHINQHLSLIHI